MRIDEYQRLAMRTSPDGHNRIENGCLGLIGESGEIVDVVKKWRFQSGDNPPFPKDKMIDECGDVLWYCAELATGIGENLNDIIKNKDVLATQYTIADEVVNLVSLCVELFENLYGRTEHDPFTRLKAQKSILFIITRIKEILEICCLSTLEEAMERNIEKLKRRYPDGFDPERSLHRAE